MFIPRSSRTRRLLVPLMVGAALISGEAPRSDIVVLASIHDHDLPTPPCVALGCGVVAAREAPFSWARAETVVLHGRSDPPEVIGEPVERVAATIRSLNPSLVIAETCFSARLEFAEALVRAGWEGWFVGSTALLPLEGFRYPQTFWSRPRSNDRATWPRAPQGFEAHAMYIDAASVAEARAAFVRWRQSYDPERGATLLDWVDPPMHIIRLGDDRAFVVMVPEEVR